MKYVLIEGVRGSEYPQEFEKREVAIDAGNKIWDAMCEQDKKNTGYFFLLESENPDEDANNHYDGEIVKRWK